MYETKDQRKADKHRNISVSAFDGLTQSHMKVNSMLPLVSIGLA